MNKKIVDFLTSEHVGALTTLIKGNIPHSAAMHFGFNPKTSEFVFFTKPVSRKCLDLKPGKVVNASFCVGFDEKKMIEFQADGEIKMIVKKDSKPFEKVFANKFKGAKLDNEHAVLVFTANWWRYTEYKPKFKVITSEK